MKHAQNIILSVLFIALIGCSTLKPEADPVVVRAEQTVKIAFDVCDAFLAWEFANRVAIPDQIHNYATSLRDSGPLAFQTARALTKAYKQNRSAENKATLDTALAVLVAMQTQSAAYIAALTR